VACPTDDSTAELTKLDLHSDITSEDREAVYLKVVTNVPNGKLSFVLRMMQSMDVFTGGHCSVGVVTAHNNARTYQYIMVYTCNLGASLIHIILLTWQSIIFTPA